MPPPSSRAGPAKDRATGARSPRLRGGAIYLSFEERPKAAYRTFSKLLASNDGVEGLVLTRQYPPDLRRDLPEGKARVYWLTTNLSVGHDTVPPTDITRLNLIVGGFLQGAVRGYVLIDCLEYLATQNSFNAVLRLVQTWNDRIVGTRNTMLITVDPLTLTLQQVHLLKREADELGLDLE